MMNLAKRKMQSGIAYSEPDYDNAQTHMDSAFTNANLHATNHTKPFKP